MNYFQDGLRALVDMKITLSSPSEIITLTKGETIHTENSYKFTHKDIQQISDWGNFELMHVFTDANKQFSLANFKK